MWMGHIHTNTSTEVKRREKDIIRSPDPNQFLHLLISVPQDIPEIE